MTATHDVTLGCKIKSVERGSEQGAIPVNPETWRTYTGISTVENSTGELPSAISRADLRDSARSLTWSDDDQVERLFVEVMMWGSGTTNGRGPRYTHSALASNGAVETLRQARALVVEGHVADAYSLYKRLTGVGPAFFTKWLWISGVSVSPTPSPQPLILDARVWAGLKTIGWDSRRAAESRRRARRYVAYLQASAVWARANGCEPEDIEYTLYKKENLT